MLTITVINDPDSWSLRVCLIKSRPGQSIIRMSMSMDCFGDLKSAMDDFIDFYYNTIVLEIERNGIMTDDESLSRPPRDGEIDDPPFRYGVKVCELDKTEHDRIYNVLRLARDGKLAVGQY